MAAREIKTFVRRPISQELAHFAVNDDTVSSVLRLVAHDASSWGGLYNIIEAVEEAVEADMHDRDAIIREGWTTKAKLKNFKHTSGSRSAAGDSARHGRERSQPPKVPMRLEDAQQLVRGVVVNWLRAKYGNTI